MEEKGDTQERRERQEESEGIMVGKEKQKSIKQEEEEGRRGVIYRRGETRGKLMNVKQRLAHKGGINRAEKVERTESGCKEGGEI